MTRYDIDLEELSCSKHGLSRLFRSFTVQEKEKAFNLPGDPIQYPPELSWKTTHLILNLNVDLDQKKVEGWVIHEILILKDEVTTFFLDSIGNDIKKVTVLNGTENPLEFFTTDEGLTVMSNIPLKKGKKIKLKIEYSRTNPPAGLYFISPDETHPNKPLQLWSQNQDEDAKFWIPCHDHPHVKFTYEGTFTVKKGLLALSNGMLVDHKERESTTTYHWKMDDPLPTYLITLVVGTFTKIELEKYKDTIVDFHVTPGREDEGMRSFGRTTQMIKIFSEKLGVDFPYPRYTQVAVTDFIFGGMENTTATTQTDRTLHDERAAIDFKSDGLVSHELAHQWFGDFLTCKQWPHAWLNESFATYMSAIWTEVSEGENEFLYEVYQDQEAYFSEDKTYRRPIVHNRFEMPIDLFDRHLYPGGACRLHMLRRLLGENDWWKSLQVYLTKNAHGVVETVDLQRAIEEVTGDSLDWFFDQWIFKAGYPEIKAKYGHDVENKVAHVQIKQVQKITDLTPLFHHPLTVSIIDKKGKEKRFTVRMKEPAYNLYIPMDQPPQDVRIDPDYSLIMSLDFEKPEDMFIFQLKNDTNVIGRIRAAHALGKKGTSKGLQALKEALLDDSQFWGVQAEIAKALASLGTDSALEILAEATTITHPKARRAVFEALAKFSGQKMLDIVKPRAEKGDESYFVEGAMGLALASSKVREAFPLVKEFITKPSWNEIIARMTLNGIPKLFEVEELQDDIITLVIEQTEYGQDAFKRATAVSTLATIYHKAKPHHRAKILSVLSDLLQDKEFHVKVAAIQAVKNIKDPRFIPTLKKLASIEVEGRIVRGAKKAVHAIQQGLSKPEELQKLRAMVEELQEENKKLLSRIEKLEAATTTLTSGNKPAKTKKPSTKKSRTKKR